MSPAGRNVFRPALMAWAEDTEQWLDGMLLEGWRPQRLIMGCVWRFVPTAERASRWYADIKTTKQMLFSDMLAPLLPKLQTVFDAETAASKLTVKRITRLEVKPEPNYRLEQFAVEEGLYRYKGARIVQSMTPDLMLRIIKQKRDEGLLRICRTRFIISLLAFVLFCCLLVWQWGMGWHLLAALPFWISMVHFAVSFAHLASKLKKDKKE